MTERQDRNIDTVQGRETPVPVGAAGERVGPARPLSIDCSASLVGNQAGMQDIVTGTDSGKAIPDPFIRRDSLSRSPPWGGGFISRAQEEHFSNYGGSVSSDVLEIRQPQKRQREDTPPHNTKYNKAKFGSLSGELKTMVTKLSNGSKELMTLIKNTPNTKAEIKKCITGVNQLVEVMHRKFKEFEMYENNEVALSTSEIKAQVLRADKTTKGGTREIGIQVNLDDNVQELVNAIEKGSSFEDVAEFIKSEWPEEVFAVTGMVLGNPSTVKEGWDVALVIDPKDQGERGLLKGIKSKYPDVEVLIKDQLEEGKVEYLQVATKIVSSRGGVEDKTRNVYLVPHTAHEGAPTNLKDLYTVLHNFKQVLLSQSRRNVAIATPEGLDRGHTRKLLEYVFRGSGIKIEYIIPGKNGQRQEEKQTRQIGGSKDGPRSVNRILIQGKGRNYADLLKATKSGVDIDKIGVKVNRIKETTKGDLLIMVEGSAEMATKLEREIKANVAGVEVKASKEETIVIIPNIDATVSQQDITEALIEAVGAEEREIFVKSLRPNRSGNQTATVATSKQVAWKLGRLGNIRLGWTECKIREKVDILRCFRCLEFGHLQRNCKSTVSRGEECLNCRKTGHKAQDCKNTSYCPQCSQIGHRSDSTRCPHFRRLLKEKTKARVGGRTTTINPPK